jgi:hypothetical protein
MCILILREGLCIFCTLLIYLVHLWGTGRQIGQCYDGVSLAVCLNLIILTNRVGHS